MSALIGTALIALGAFWLSFTALTDLAVRAGVSADQAWAWPLIVDGVIIVSTVAVIALVGHGRVVSAYPWALILVSTGVSVLANIAHAVVVSAGSVPAVVAAGVAAVPPVTLVASTHLSSVLLTRADRTPRVRAHAPVLSVQHPAALSAHGERPVSAHSGRPIAELPGWFQEQVDLGSTPTGTAVAREFGVSTATGRRRLAELRAHGSAAAELPVGAGPAAG